MEFKAYHKIRQFYNIVRDIQFKANFQGQGSDGEPLYEETVKPTLTFIATTKLHGTNAGVCYTPKKGVVAQKRGSLIGKEELASHFGFNQFVQVEKKLFFTDLMEELYTEHCKFGEQLTIYGEWAGKGIQKSVGISELPKGFYIFDCKIYNAEKDTQRWLDITDWIFESDKVFNINEFPTWKLNIDFNKPGLFQNKLVEITEQIEKECPVSKQLGIDNSLGEGAVWTCYWNEEKYIFKVKGEKHSVSRVKKLASVDPEVVNSIYEFVEYACTPNRIEQGIQEVNATEKRDMPALLKWVVNDIITEETDTLIANGLEWKQVASNCSNRVRQYFFNKIEKV
ncbi:MAG: hypothetical protein ACJAVA_000229 [Flavobacteriaceae bacterium]|jgi:hypothetical protein